MLAWVAQWVKSLVVIVLLGNVAEFLLPKGDLKRYAGLLVGLVVLLAMISPFGVMWRGVAVPTLNGAGTAASGSWQTAVAQEELSQARAMVMALPGVTACQVRHPGSGAVAVSVTADGQQATTTLIRYAKAAVAVATGSQQPVRVFIKRPAAMIHNRRSKP